MSLAVSVPVDRSLFGRRRGQAAALTDRPYKEALRETGSGVGFQWTSYVAPVPGDPTNPT